MQPLLNKAPLVPLCRHPEPKVQGGHSKFNFGFIGLATRTPVKQNSATDAHKWFKEYMAIANTAGKPKSTPFDRPVKRFEE